MYIEMTDVLDVADSIGITLTQDQIDFVLENFVAEAASDPTANWRLLVENLIYQITKK